MQFSMIDAYIEKMLISIRIFKTNVSFLQKHFKLLHIKIANVNLNLKYAKQELNQIINKIILYVKKFENSIV